VAGGERDRVLAARRLSDGVGFDGRLLGLNHPLPRLDRLHPLQPHEEREFRVRAFFVALVFLCSIPIAFVSPGLAPLLWLALFLDPVSRFARASRDGR
jgi:hypothetical protein